MRKALRQVYLLCMSVVLLTQVRCGRPEYLSEKDLLEFVSDEKNRLCKTVSGGGIDAKVIYRPTDLLVAQELIKSKEPSPDQIEKARKKYGDYYYFILSLSKDDREVITPASLGSSRFGDLLQTVSFRMGQFVNLTTSSSDTIAVSDYVYNRTFGMGSSSDLMMVFSRERCIGQQWVQFNLREFGLGIGNQSLRFNVKDLNRAPKIYNNIN